MAGTKQQTARRDSSASLDDVRRQDTLVRTVEREVVPRLVLARRAALRQSAPGAAGGEVPGPGDVAELASLALKRDTAAATAYVASLHAHGTTAEALYLDLLAPAARHLGDLWVEDTCSFTEVTVGLVRLQQVLHGLSPAFQAEAERRAAAHVALHALLVPLPGSQHTFGLAMVADFFRRAGWKVSTGTVASRDDLAGMVHGQAFDLVGFSVSCDRHLDALASCIRLVRRASRNRAVGVMVGGPVFAEHPEIATLVGADATAIDGRQAPVQAQTLLAALTGCSQLDAVETRARGMREALAEEDLVSRGRESTQGLQGAGGVAWQLGRGDRRRGHRGGC